MLAVTLANGLKQLSKKIFGQMRLLGVLILASVLLSGCVQYQVGVNFDNPNQGEIVQHIKLGERLTSFSSDSIAAWLDSIDRRARQLQGKAKRLSNQEVTVTIPFNNGAELAEKFNAFFNPTGKKKLEQAAQNSEIPQIDSHLKLNQNNFLLLVRNHLSYDLDLRSLELISTNGNLIVNSSPILEFEFSLNTPWGARSIEVENTIHPESDSKGQQLLWRLQPGQLNHVEAVFWLPSPIGIGTVVIILFVVAGIYLRYKFMPDPRTMYRPTVSPQG